MKRFAFLLPVLVLAGCQGPSLVGSWTADVDTTVSKVPVTLDMKPDGTWTGHMKSASIKTAVVEIPPVTVDASGTWKLDGETLTWNGAKANVTDAPPLVMPFKAKVEDDIKTSINRWNSAKVKFTDKDTATFTLQGGDSVTLKRVGATEK